LAALPLLDRVALTAAHWPTNSHWTTVPRAYRATKEEPAPTAVWLDQQWQSIHTSVTLPAQWPT